MSLELQKAQEYEAKNKNEIPEEEKPLFHVAPPIGWMNDPNGFSFYQGKVHLFYQYHPYSREWGPMHWGHSVSEDMIHWEQLPVALAPDMEYDKAGCFSGSAVEADRKHVLIYTGVTEDNRQNQCIAFGDGLNYEKGRKNPVITGDMLPEECSRIDFRDPKVWKNGDTYYLVAGNKNVQKKGQVVLFSSKNLEDWKFETILAENTTGTMGTMWECPDFFQLDGVHFLVCSPQNMKAQKYEFHSGNNSVFFAGEYNEETHEFHKEEAKSLDYGLDYYAPQTTELPDGRRILIAWMKSWDSCMIPDEQKWQGMTTIPRELRYINGHLYQNPVKELEKYRANSCCYANQLIEGEQQFEGIKGRTLDLTVEICGGDFKQFQIDLAHNDEYTTSFVYDSEKQTMEVDRTYCGVIRDVVCRRTWKLLEKQENLKLRFIIDKQSIELFINDGEQVASTVICTPIDADEILFNCQGSARVNVEKYDIVK